MGTFVVSICLGLIVVLFGAVIGLTFKVNRMSDELEVLKEWREAHEKAANQPLDLSPYMRRQHSDGGS